MTTEARAEAVTEAVAERRGRVNEAFEAALPIAHPTRLYEASRYLLDAGGKRLRPAMLLLVAEALADVPPLSEPYREFPAAAPGVAAARDDRRRDVMAAALSVESIQTFTLIHDDIMDDDDRRRGVRSVHREYDDATAILAGDTLYSKAFEFLLETGAPPDGALGAMGALARACTRICEGQALDLGFEGRDDVTADAYAEMIERKTAVLYGASAAIPGHLLGADEAVVDALRAYGVRVGQAFQIHDDVLDLTASSDRLGKDRGSDLVEGKRTLITVHAREQGIDVDGLVGDDPSPAEIDAAVDRLREAGSIDHARETARDLVDEGIDGLSVLPDNEAHERLVQLAEYLIEREY
jgi:geranylgeranyl diphosphate synthase type I